MATEGAGRVRTFEPPRGARREFGEAWRYRHACLYFVRAFIRRRYGRTFLGYLWLVLPVAVPLFTGALVFGGILGVDVGDVPYFLYFAVASGAWLTFASTVILATRCLEMTRAELRRVYVPRLVPLSAAVTLPLTTLIIYSGLAGGAVVFYLIERGESYLALRPVTLLVPVAIAALILFGLACGLWFSPVGARARDVRRLAGYTLGFWYFLTPVIYPIEEIPEDWRFLASLNPVTAPIETVKWGLLEVGEVTELGVAVFFATLVLVTAVGLRIFIPRERRDVERYY